MANLSRPTIRICGFRLAKLDVDGNPLVGADNMIECSSVISLALTFEVKDGTTIEVRNGCDDTCVFYAAPDTLNGLTLAMPICDLDAEVITMGTGGTRVLSGADTIGHFSPLIGAVPDPTALEVWTWRLNANGTDQDGTLPWHHWIFPKTLWRMGNMTLQNGETTPSLEATVYENPNYTDGPAHDLPLGENGQYIQGLWGVFAANDFPDLTCELLTTVAS